MAPIINRLFFVNRLILVPIASFMLSHAWADDYATPKDIRQTNIRQIVTLKESLDLALQNDTQWSSIQKQIQADKEVLAQSKAGLLPNINASAETSKNKVDVENTDSNSANSHAASIQISQPLVNLNQWLLYQQAKKQVAQLDSNQATEELSLITKVTESYFNVLKAKRNLDFSQAEKQALAKQLDQAEQRFKVGLAAMTDVHEARAAFDLAEVSVLVAQNDIHVFLEALSTLCGQSIENVRELSETFTIEKQPHTLSWWIEQATLNSPKMKAQQHALESQKLAKKAAKASHLPTLHLEGSHSESEGFFGGFSQPPTENTKIGLQLTIPIYQGGRTASDVRKAQALYLVQVDQLETTRRTLAQNIRILYRSIDTDRERIAARKQSIQSAESALNATRAGYQVGTRNIVDVVNAQRVLLGAQKDFALARYEFVINQLKLQETAGLLSTTFIAKVNEHLK